MIKAAVIGLGWWGKHLLNVLEDSEKIRIVCAVDTAAETGSAIAAEKRVSFTSDYEEALQSSDIDAVLITTPNTLHEEQSVRAAQAGKHVLCEKPLGLTRDSAERIVAACEKAGVVLGVGHERRFEPAMRELKRMVDAGEFGSILHVEAAFSHDKLRDVDMGNWRVSKIDSPVPAMTGMGIHLSDLFIHMLGDIAEVDARTARVPGATYEGEALSVQVAFRGGATGHLSAILTTPLFLRFHIFGSEAWAEVRNDTHPDTPGVTHLTVCRRSGDPETRDFAWLDATKEGYEAFADAVAGKSAYPFSTQQKIHNVAVTEAVFQSAATGRPVAVV